MMVKAEGSVQEYVRRKGKENRRVVPGVTLPANTQVITPCATPLSFDAILNIPETAAPGISWCAMSVPVIRAG